MYQIMYLSRYHREFCLQTWLNSLLYIMNHIIRLELYNDSFMKTSLPEIKIMWQKFIKIGPPRVPLDK